MSSHPHEHPDMKGYRLENARSQPGSVLPTLTKLQAGADYGNISNNNAGRAIEERSLEDITRRMDALDGLSDLAQIRTEENEERETTEKEVLLLSARADAAELKFERLGIVRNLDEAIEYRSQVLSLTPDGHEEKPSRFGALGSAFLRRYRRIGDLSDLNKAIDQQTRAVLLAHDESTHKPASLNNLGITYQARFGRLGELADLEKAIEYATQAVLLTPDGNAEKPNRLNNLGASYSSRFQRLGKLEDLNKAIEHQTQAVLLTPDRSADKPSQLNNLGSFYRFRFVRLGELADLDKAIECQNEAVQLTPNGHASKPIRLNNLGNSFYSRFGRLGELADLNKAINLHTQAVLLTPDGHPDKPRWLNNIGASYSSRFRRQGMLEDLNKAIEHQTNAVLLTPDEHPDKPRWLNNIGTSYQSRFQRLGELADLNTAIEYQTKAVLLTPDGHTAKPSRLSNLGTSYHSRFRRLGELPDVNKAIEYQSKAVLLTPDGHADKPNGFKNLGNSYHSRFRRLGEVVDLNKAIKHQTNVVLLTPDGHASKPSSLNNLGNSYYSRFGRMGDLADLNKAIDFQTQAVLLTPDGHADKPTWLNNLGNSHHSRFCRLGALSDLNQAINYQAQAVLLTPDGHAAKPRWLNNLGVSYESRFGRLGELADLNMAIECQTKATLLTPDGYSDKPSLLNNLGNSYNSRFRNFGGLSDLESARISFQKGAQLIITNPQVQSTCARRWALCSLSLGFSPQSAYELCMELIPHLIWLGTTIDQRYVLLGEISNLATEAAAWAISTNALELALEWLEEGRSIVWSQILQLRTPFDDLFLVDPVLAQDLKETASKLEAAGSRLSSHSTDNGSPDIEMDAQHHHHLASEWERLLERARALPGFERFLRPRKASDLMPSATDGPVVVLNAHPTRCDALILLPGSDNISHLCLSNSLSKLEEARDQLQSLVGLRGDRAGGFKRSKPEPKPEDPFKSILAACWSDIVQRVLGILACKRDIQIEELPHVTWCTTGALSFLPLHAAGLYDGSQPNAPDLVVSSYTPTLSALLPIRAAAANLNSGVLAVGQEHTQGFCWLPSTVPELAAIKEHAKEDRFQQLTASNATVKAVLDAMDKNSWVHLACHATQSLDNPAQSAFHLHDGPLALGAITKRSFKNKGLAFLSACQTATGDKKLADEAVHLAAGMLMAGYPSVIATMWSIQDEDGPLIAEAVYADLLKDGEMDHRQAARALHKAVAGLRRKVGDEAFKRWVPFIHIGV